MEWWQTTLVCNVTESQTVVKGGSEKLPFILPFTTVWGILLFRDAITVIDSQLGEDLAPVNSAAGPFFRNIPHGQIQHFEQAVIRRENGLGFCHFPELAVESLNIVRGIDQSAKLFRKLEIGAEIGPVPAPGFGDLGVLLVLFFSEILQSIQGALFIHSGVNPFQISHEGLNVLV